MGGPSVNLGSDVATPSSSSYLKSETAAALCDIVALRCADTNNKAQAAALEVATALISRHVDPAVLDASSPRWISCLATALASGYSAVNSSAVTCLRSICQRCSTDNLRNLFHTMAMTAMSVRNNVTKVNLISGLRDVLARHRQLIVLMHHPQQPSQQPTGVRPTGNLLTSNTPPTSSALLTLSDLQFVLDLTIRIFQTDARPDVRMMSEQLLLSLHMDGFDGDEKMLLDNPRWTTEQWTEVKGMLDRHKAQAPDDVA